jgi:hypothetical protein
LKLNQGPLRLSLGNEYAGRYTPTELLSRKIVLKKILNLTINRSLDQLYELNMGLLVLEYDNSAANPGVARMDGFENAGTLLVRLELHTSELGKSLGGPIAGRGTRQKNLRITPSFR